jgi:hypothetical protein
MPHIESELARVQGSCCFATFDFSHGYWQLPIAEDSQECQSFLTPDGVFTPTRVLHGNSNAVMHLQASLQGILTPLEKQLLYWLDDLPLYADNEISFFQHLRTFFSPSVASIASSCTPASAFCSRLWSVSADASCPARASELTHGASKAASKWPRPQRRLICSNFCVLLTG